MNDYLGLLLFGLLLVQLISCVSTIFIGLKLIANLRRLNARKANTTTRLPGPITGTFSQERPDVKEFMVPELPPEVIAPRLKNPPKSTGFVAGDKADSDQ